MDVFYNKLEADPSTIGMDVVGGRLDLVSATSIRWSFLNSNQIRLVNPDTGRWELVKAATEPTIANTALDLNGTALAPNTIYDVFAEYDSATAFNLVLSRWATGGDGANNSSTSYATPVMTGYAEPGPWGIGNDNESGSPAYKAFTQGASAADYWGATSSIGTGHYIILNCGGANSICINKYAIRSRNTGYNANCCPSSFKLQASHNLATWVDLESLHTGVAAPGANTWSSYYPVKNQIAYKYYRLLVTANVSGDETNIGELKLVAAANSLAGSSSRVGAYEATVTYNIGDRVTYGGHDWVKTSTAAAGTTPVAGAAWVDNGTSVSGDFAGLYRHDGVLVSDSSSTGKKRRWLGIIYTYNNSGTVNFKDDTNYGYISNFYNTKHKIYRAYNSTVTSYTFTNAAPQETNNGSGAVRANIISCITQSTIVSDYTVNVVHSSTGAAAWIGIGLNSTSSASFLTGTTFTVANTQTWVMSGQCGLSIPIGFNYITQLEDTTGATATVYTGRSSADFMINQ